MFICSPISSAFALLGSAVSTLVALGLGVSSASLYMGLWGYSAVLTSIAIGGMFFVMNRPSAFFFAVFSSVATCIIQGATNAFMTPFGLPALTFPFNLAAWIFCLAGHGMGNLFAVEITALSIPEDHIKRVRLVQQLTSKFSEIRDLKDILNITIPEDLNLLERSLTPVLICHYAANGELEQLKSLISLGVDLNLVDYDGRSALHLAAAENQQEILKLLVRDEGL